MTAARPRISSASSMILPVGQGQPGAASAIPAASLAVTGQFLHAGVGQAGPASAAPQAQARPLPGLPQIPHPTPSAQLDSLASTLAGHAARLARRCQSVAVAVAVTPPSPGDSPAGASPSASPLPQLNPLQLPAQLPGGTAGAHGARSGAQQAPGQGLAAAAAVLHGAHAARTRPSSGGLGAARQGRRQVRGSDTLTAAGPEEDIAIDLSSGSEDSDFAPIGVAAADTSMDELEGAGSSAYFSTKLVSSSGASGLLAQWHCQQSSAANA